MLAGAASVRASDDGCRAPKNFVFFNLDRERILEPSFLETAAIDGAQLKYTWRELEPQRDRYELEPLLRDVEVLRSHGKRLFVQLQDVSFDERLNVPDYLLEDPAFHGGAARKSEESDDGSGRAFDGWVARRWDPAVIERMAKLFQALAEAVNGEIEGLNLAETSIGFGPDAARHPEGFTYASYAEGMRSILSAARAAFQQSEVIVYANFMPGEWLPWEDNGYLRSIYEHAERIGAGVGGPDLIPHRKGQQNHAYHFIATRGPGVVAGVAVQDGNLAERNPATGEPVTAAELYRFACESLRLEYLFWGTEEPYYSQQVLPLLRGLSKWSGVPQPTEASRSARRSRDQYVRRSNWPVRGPLLQVPRNGRSGARRVAVPGVF